MEDKELKIEFAIATIKGTLSNIPVLGGFFNEYLFEVRSRVKQERINKFISSFAEYITQLKEVNLKPEQIEKEEFGDFFEEIIKRVSKTSSESKKEAFKKLLANQLTNPKDYDYAEILLEIIGSLQEKQIPILYDLYRKKATPALENKGALLEKQKLYNDLIKQRSDVFFSSTTYENPNDDPQVRTLNDRVSKVDSEIHKLKVKLGMDPYNRETDLNIPQMASSFLLQDLCNKGLAIDISMKYGAAPFSMVKISSLGVDLLHALS